MPRHVGQVPLGARRALAGTTSPEQSLQRLLVAERAAALGRVGRKLADAIDTHRLLIEVGEASDEQVEAALDAVAAALWSLVVQRECAGFRGDVLTAICAAYPVPDAATRRLGRRPPS